MAKGYMYILKCCEGSFYTGSTKFLELRVEQHQSGKGANFTSARLPVELVYFEEFDRIDHAFDREHQVKKWGRAKKLALINGQTENLNNLAECQNETHSRIK